MYKARALPLVVWLCVAMAWPTFSPAQTKAIEEGRVRFDSLLRLPGDTSSLDAFIALCEEYQVKDVNFAYEIAGAGLARASEIDAPARTADLHELRAFNALNLLFYDTAAHHYESALALFAEARDTLRIAQVYLQYGDADMNAGRVEGALSKYEMATELFRDLGDVTGEGMGYASLSNVLLTMEREEEAMDFARRAYRKAEIVGDTFGMARVEGFRGIALGKLGRVDDGLAAARAGSEIADALDIPILDYEMSMVLSMILTDAGRYEEALPQLERAADLAQVVYGTRYEDAGLVSLAAEANLATGREAEAIRLLRIARGLGESRAGSHEGQEVYDALATAFAALNQHDSAYHYARLGSAAKDSLYAERNADALSELQTRYQTEEKEAEIERQSAELSTQRRNLYLTFGGLALALAVAGGVGYLALALRRRNAEREVLIKEVHHRVKNNLQTLSSLLYLQGRHIDDEAASEAMRASQARVEAMGLIHRRLYTTDHLTGVAVAEYVPELAETLVDAFGADERVSVETDVQPLVLDVDTAIPLGLILNELITNSLKYAFPAGTSGTLSVSLREVDSALVLRVSDDGAGTGAVVGEGQSTGFGGELVDMLSQKLQGRLEVENTSGGYATTVYVGAYEVVGAAAVG